MPNQLPVWINTHTHAHTNTKTTKNTFHHKSKPLDIYMPLKMGQILLFFSKWLGVSHTQLMMMK